MASVQAPAAERSTNFDSTTCGVYPLFDAFLDIAHPGASSLSNVNLKRVIVAPPKHAFELSRDVGVELMSTENGLQRVAAFCFPDYFDDGTNNSTSTGSAVRIDSTDPTSPGLTKYDIHMKDFYYSNNSNFNVTGNTSGPAYHTFAMQLSSGIRVYGHVRRYFPHHNIARSRIDVGRRAARAMVILTRADGAHQFYHSLLKTMEMINSLHNVANTSADSVTTQKQQQHPLESFLHQVHAEHSKLANAFQNKIQASLQSSMPSLINFGLKNIEIHHRLFAGVDLTKFIIPTPLLLLQQSQLPAQQQATQKLTTITSSSDAPILPILRCLGIAHTLRLLSALLCERRIILVSSSTTKLTTCMNSLLSILSQGCLSWQHIFIPVLPPSMIDHLAAPMPYLIGLLSPYGQGHQLEQIHGLGEVLVVYLDVNQPYGEFKIFGIAKPDLFIPDILTHDDYNYIQSSTSQYGYGQPNVPRDPIAYQQQLQQQQQYGGGGNSSPYYNNNNMQQQYQYPYQPNQLSVADTLKLELVRILKEDKKSRTTSTGGVSGTAAIAATKGKDLIKKGFGKLKSAARKTLKGVDDRLDNEYNNNVDSSVQGYGDDPPGNESAIIDPTPINELYSYNEGYDNLIYEEETRIAFTAFFLTYIGDMRQYLTKPNQSGGGPPSFDKDLFKLARIKVGEYENSPMYNLSVHFKESQIFEQFVNARINDISQRRVFSPTLSPLFQLALQYHNAKQIPFTSFEVQGVLKRLSNNRPVTEYINVISHIRSRAISLTSNNRNEALASKALRNLAQECWECRIYLVEVMNVVWDRLRDSRGMQWKHGLYALQIMQELILHGPLAAIAEVTDGLDKIKRMKLYENVRSNAARDIRNTAAFVYSLLVNRSRLLSMRRICAQKRREMNNPVRYQRDSRIDVGMNRNLRLHLMTFKKVHALVKPEGVVGVGTKTNGGAGGIDLLGMDTSTLPIPPAQQHQAVQTQQPTSNPIQMPQIAQQQSLVNMMSNASIVTEPGSHTGSINPPIPTGLGYQPTVPVTTTMTSPPETASPPMYNNNNLSIPHQSNMQTSPPKTPQQQQQLYGVPQQYTHPPVPPTYHQPTVPMGQMPQQQSMAAAPIYQGYKQPQQPLPTNRGHQYNATQQQPQQPVPQQPKPSYQFDPFA